MDIKPTINKPEPAAAKPAQPVATPKPTIVSAPHKPTTNKKNKKISKKELGVICGLIVAIILVVVAIVAIVNNQPTPEPVDEDNPVAEVLTEEEKKVTQQTMDNVEITVDGYQHVTDENGEYNGVAVSVKNAGDKRTCIAIDVVAKDEKGTILDKSSLYAEGIEPEQTQNFLLFVYSELSPEVLKNAKYEVYKAYTYNVDTPAEEPAPAPAEESAPAESTEESAPKGGEASE